MTTDALYLPFFNATREVFNLMLDLNNISENPNAIESAGSDGKINIAIGVTGDLEGEIFYHFPKETTLEMVKIMSGMDFPEVDEFVTSAIGEIANIISGKALISLSQQKIACDILPPRIISDDEENPFDGTLLKSSTRITTEIGDVDLDIKLKAK